MQALELDNADLSKRLVELKMTEIDRMNDVNKICNEMMRNARSMERAAAAESSSRQVLGKFFNANKSNGLRQGMAAVRLILSAFIKLCCVILYQVSERMPDVASLSLLSYASKIIETWINI